MSTTSKNSRIFGACMNTPFTKVTTWSSFVTSMVARLMKATISPTVAAPFWCRAMPVMKIAVMVSVPEARVATFASAHHDRTGICTRSRSWMMSRIASFSARARVKDWITATLPSASEAWAASPDWNCSTSP
ncbi:hypothetical protein CHKEEEPN_2184 [Methylorubrum podarium]|nr:hypothetical protein CHKEEEPN_2184 [Methylorubrum podarium]